MKRKLALTSAIVLPVLCLWSIIGAQPSQPKRRSLHERALAFHYTQPLYEPGLITGTLLANFVPDRLRQACDLLLKKRVGEATPKAAFLFRKELAKHPQDLAAYIGLLQADPSILATESRRLKMEVDRNKGGLAAKFKLSVALFYCYSALPTMLQREEKYQKLMAPAFAFMEKVWEVEKKPLVGFMLTEMYFGSPKLTPNAALLKDREIMDRLLLALGGQAIYSRYLQAKANLWNATPPPVQWVPIANRADLWLVIHYLWGIASVHVGRGTLLDGTSLIVVVELGQEKLEEKKYADQTAIKWNPMPPIQLRQSRYLVDWEEALKKAGVKPPYIIHPFD